MPTKDEAKRDAPVVTAEDALAAGAQPGAALIQPGRTVESQEIAPLRMDPDVILADELPKTKKEREDVAPEGFTLEQWGAYVKFQCSFCPWDTLHRPNAVDHFIGAHAGRPVVRVDARPVPTDRFGNPVD